MKMLIRGGRVIDPANDIDEVLDVLVDQGKIAGMAPELAVECPVTIEAAGKIVTPGLIDMHVHLRQPGREEYKETISTGTRAAAKGGFTTVACEPNTSPPIDSPKRVSLVLSLAKNDAVVHLLTKACITMALRGKSLVNVKGVVRAGAVAITDDGFPVFDIELMKKAALEARKLHIPICPHSEETRMTGPREAYAFERQMSEARLIRKYISHVVEETGCSFHFPHVSLAESVQWIEDAKTRGLPVTAEATPHHFSLTSEEGRMIGPNAKVNPPLREKADVDAIRCALARDVIDVIASDHAPHTDAEKAGEDPPFGIIGLETTLGMVLTHLVKPRVVTLSAAIRKMTVNPASILGISAGRLSPGARADVTIIDQHKKWTVDPNEFESKGRNCPFAGHELEGMAVATIVGGTIAMYEGRVFDSPLKYPHEWQQLYEPSQQMILPMSPA